MGWSVWIYRKISSVKRCWRLEAIKLRMRLWFLWTKCMFNLLPSTLLHPSFFDRILYDIIFSEKMVNFHLPSHLHLLLIQAGILEYDPPWSAQDTHTHNFQLDLAGSNSLQSYSNLLGITQCCFYSRKHLKVWISIQ